MKKIFFLLVFCFSLVGIEAQNYITLDGKVFKDGIHVYTTEQTSSREVISGLRSSGCDECRPKDLIIKPDPSCLSCKTSLVAGKMIPQLKDLGGLDPALKILRMSVFKLTKCQKDQFELVEVIGKPTDDAVIHGIEGTAFVGADFNLEPDNFYLVLIVVKNPLSGCPTWMRQEIFESFYVKPCSAGGNFTGGTVNVVSKRNAVIVNQKGEQYAESKNDTTTFTVNQEVSNYTLEYNDTMTVSVTPDTISVSVEVIKEVEKIVLRDTFKTEKITVELQQATGTSSGGGTGDNAIKVYPNPFVGSLGLEIPEINNRNLQLSVVSVGGKNIETIKNLQTTNTVGEGWGSGIYIITVQGEGVVPKSFKVIKQ